MSGEVYRSRGAGDSTRPAPRIQGGEMTESPSVSRCPACSRPIATARETCLYCGAVLSAEARALAVENADRILRSDTLPALSAIAQTTQNAASRTYIVLDVAGASEATLSSAFSISRWEARQWGAGPRYRLVRVSADAEADPAFAAPDLTLHVLPGEAIQRARTPVRIHAVDDLAEPLVLSTRPDPEGPVVRRELIRGALSLIVYAPVRREKAPEVANARKPARTRLEDGLLVHLHMEGEPQPLEIDARRTAFEGEGPPSAFLRSMALIRRLSETVPLDDSFRLVVPALAPAPDSDDEVEGLRKATNRSTREPRRPTYDNAAQFRDYSAWRGALARHLRGNPTGER